MTLKTSRRQEILFISVIVIAALLIRLYPIITILPQDVYIHGDSAVYLQMARDLSNGDFSFGVIGDRGGQAHRGILFSSILAPFFLIFGDSLLTAKLVGVIIGCILVIGVYYLGKIVFDERVGMLGAIFMVFDPFMYMYSSGAILSEQIYFLMTIICFYFFYKGLKNEKYFILSGAFAGLSYLARPTGILFFLLIFIGLLIYKRNYNFSYKPLLYFVSAFLLFSMPNFIIRGYYYGNPIFTGGAPSAFFVDSLEEWLAVMRDGIATGPSYYLARHGLLDIPVRELIGGFLIVRYTVFNAPIISLLALVGLVLFRAPRYYLFHVFIISHLLIYAWVGHIMVARITCVPLIPFLIIIASAVLLKLKSLKSIQIGRLKIGIYKYMTLIFVFLVVLTIYGNFVGISMHNCRYEDIKSYSEFGNWVRDNTKEESVIFMNGRYPGFYASQLAPDRIYEPLSNYPGSYKQPKYIALRKEYMKDDTTEVLSNTDILEHANLVWSNYNKDAELEEDKIMDKIMKKIGGYFYPHRTIYIQVYKVEER